MLHAAFPDQVESLLATAPRLAETNAVGEGGLFYTGSSVTKIAEGEQLPTVSELFDRFEAVLPLCELARSQRGRDNFGLAVRRRSYAGLGPAARVRPGPAGLSRG